MRSGFLLGLTLIVACAACAREPQKQWMKAGPYTSEEFRRDVAACSRDAKLDDACLEARGWFTVKVREQAQKREAPSYKSAPSVPAPVQ
jgi:hypothetical protein